MEVLLKSFSILIAGYLIGCFVTWFWFDPLPRSTITQRAILDEYLGIYCNKGDALINKNEMFMAGNAAALSRVAIKAGLGDIALSEYVKCKLLGGK